MNLPSTLRDRIRSCAGTVSAFLYGWSTVLNIFGASEMNPEPDDNLEGDVRAIGDDFRAVLGHLAPSEKA